MTSLSLIVVLMMSEYALLKYFSHMKNSTRPSCPRCFESVMTKSRSCKWFLIWTAAKSQAQPPWELQMWIWARLCVIGFQILSRRQQTKELLSAGSALGRFSPLLLYFPCSDSSVSQKGSLKLFKLSDDAVVGLIMDDELLYTVSNAARRRCIQSETFLFGINRYNNERVSLGKRQDAISHHQWAEK